MATTALYTRLNNGNTRGFVCATFSILIIISGAIFACVVFALTIRDDIKRHKTNQKFIRNSVETKCVLQNYFLIGESQFIVLNIPEYDYSTCVRCRGIYLVNYQLTNQSRIQSVIYAEDVLTHSDKKINLHYPCFYDKTNVTRVVWNLSSVKFNHMLILIVSFTAVVMTVTFPIYIYRIYHALC